jgi:putative cardiolipin synthase
MNILEKITLSLLILLGVFRPNFAFADDLKYLAHPNESLSAYMTIAERAKVSIDLATFVFEPCQTFPKALIDVFVRKAKAGVKVRLLLDASGHTNEEKQELANFFTGHGIQVRYYNDFIVFNPGMNLRMHTKFMNVDSEIYISGGRNMSDEYFAMSDKQNWVDRDVLVQGKSAQQVKASFNEMWNDDMTSVRRGRGASFAGWAKFCGENLSQRGSVVRGFVEAKAANVLAAIPARSCDNVKFFTDHPQFGNPMFSGGSIYDDQLDTYMTPARLKMKRTTNRILSFIRGSRERLDMENWAYMPTGFLRQAFSKLRDRHVAVNLVTNQDMEIGPSLVQRAEEYIIAKFSGEDSVGSQRIKLLSSLGGLKDPFELTVPNVVFYVHAKVFVRDNRDVVVSSFNLDSRSYSTNLESAVVVLNCPAFAADVKNQIVATNAVYEGDRAKRLIPEKAEPDAFTKFFALMNITQF